MVTTQHMLSISAGAFVMAFALWLWVRWFRSPDRARWMVDPLVVLTRECPASIDDVQWAVDWWKRRGARFAWAIARRVGEVPHEPGSIVLTAGPRNDPSLERVMAERDPTERGAYSRVVIALPDTDFALDSGRRHLLHLFGHALGLRHVQRRGHVMAANPRRRGWGDEGMVAAMATIFGRSPSSLAATTDHAMAGAPQPEPGFSDNEPARPRLLLNDLHPPLVH